MKQHNFSLDVLRGLACLMVVIMHAPLPGDASDALLLSSISYLTAPCIGLFFMLSGALLLPVQTDTVSFIKKRVSKIAVPAVAWTLFYIVMNIWLRDDAFSWRVIMSVPFTPQGTQVLWFVYTMLGLYLLAPILSRWVVTASRSEIKFYLLLWAITLCYPLIAMVADVNASTSGVLYYFTGYAGYFLLGYYIRQYPPSWRWVAPGMVMALAAPIACKAYGWTVDFYSVFWYLSPFVVTMCVFWWNAVHILPPPRQTKFRQWLPDCVSLIARLSFGIYLVHIFVMRYVLWEWSFITGLQPYWLQVIVIALGTFAFSLCLCLLIGYLPGAKYLIGYKNRMGQKTDS